MTNFNGKLKIMIAILVILAFTLPTAFAADTIPTINSLIFDVNGVFHEVDLDDWGEAYRAGQGDPLYDEYIGYDIVGIRSGDKYVELASFADKYRELEGDVAGAIDEADELIIDEIVKPDPPDHDYTAEDLGIEVTTLVPGSFNIAISLDNAADLLGASAGDILELRINDDVIDLVYDEGKELFHKNNVQGYTEEDLKKAIVTVKEYYTAEDLGIEVTTLVPGAYNIAIPLDNAADLLGASAGDILEFSINDDVMDLVYDEGKELFHKLNVQGYDEEDLKKAIVTVK